MTLLPTVRRQLEQAAERYSGRRDRRWGLRGPRLPFGLTQVVPTIAAIAALGIAALFVVLLHHSAPRTAPTSSSGTARPLLEGNGIGSVKFGQRQATATSQLKRLLGRPASSTPGICGFGPEITWVGADIKPKRFPAGHRFFRAQLVVGFKGSRFVGYAYLDDQYLTPRGPGSEVSMPLDSPEAQKVLHGPRLMLATARGLTTGDPTSRGRRLYGHAFTESYREQGTPPDPRLTRLPVWEADTATGRLIGAIWHAAPVGPATNFFGAAQSTIGSIGAGTGPNTPCSSKRSAPHGTLLTRTRDAHVIGVVETCGGAPPGRCRTEKAGLVFVVNSRNEVVARQRVTTAGRFSFWLVPGRYVLRPDKPNGLPIRPVTAVAHTTQTANIVFAIP